MKIGAIAQHSNIGPETHATSTLQSTNNLTSFGDFIPSILNNHKLYAWLDFTDESQVANHITFDFSEFFGISNIGFHRICYFL